MKGTDMTVREFLAMEIDVDVVDDVEERVYIAFCGPCKLTKFGEEKFKDILDCTVTYWEKYCQAVINLDKYEDWEHKLDLAELLFVGFAGYIPDSQYKKLFKED